MSKFPPEKCYNCNSENISNEETVLGADEVSCKIICQDCFETWFEVYKFSHIEKLKDLQDAKE